MTAADHAPQLPNGITLRRGVRADLDRIGGLWQTLHAHHLALPEIGLPPRDAASSWEVRRGFYERVWEDGADLWLAERDGAPVGYAFVHGASRSATWMAEPVAMLHTLVVDPAERGAGIGEALMRTAFDALRARGVTDVEVGYIEGNERAAALYRRMGFRPIQREMTLRLG